MPRFGYSSGYSRSKGSRLQQYRQVGNAVPPLLASALGTHLAEAAGFEVDSERYGAEPDRGVPPPARTMEEHLHERRHLIRGASIGDRRALRRIGPPRKIAIEECSSYRKIAGAAMLFGHAGVKRQNLLAN